MAVRFNFPPYPEPPLDVKDLPERDRICAELYKLGNPDADRLKLELDAAWAIINSMSGTSSTEYKDRIFFCHPKVPPHYWDGEKMVPFHAVPVDGK